MRTYKPQRAILTCMILLSHVLISCLNPWVGPGQEKIKAVEEPAPQLSSSQLEASKLPFTLKTDDVKGKKQKVKKPRRRKNRSRWLANSSGAMADQLKKVNRFFQRRVTLPVKEKQPGSLQTFAFPSGPTAGQVVKSNQSVVASTPVIPLSIKEVSLVQSREISYQAAIKHSSEVAKVDALQSSQEIAKAKRPTEVANTAGKKPIKGPIIDKKAIDRFLRPVFRALPLLEDFVTNITPIEPSPLNKNRKLLDHVLKDLDTYYINEIDYGRLVETGMQEMLRSLDPYTKFIPENGSLSHQDPSKLTYPDMGVIVGMRQGKYIILELDKDAPAHQEGLKVGDEMVQIGGEQVYNQTKEQVSRLLQGRPNTTANVTVVRQGIDKPIQVKIKRTTAKHKNVTYAGQVKDDIGYIKLAEFNDQAAQEVKAALQTLRANGTKNLILDLRDNPGGSVKEAVEIMNLFLEKGLPLLNLQGKPSALVNTTYTTKAPAYASNMPLVILMNEKSASASETLAGVIQDYDRGVLIGSHSYGKAIVQAVTSLPYKGRLKLTVAQAYLPSGRNIQKNFYKQQSGTQPNIDVSPEPDSTFQTKNGRVVHKGKGLEPDLEVKSQQLAPITQSLLNQGLIFDYAVLFCAKHTTVAPAKEFRLSEEQYQEFLAWLATQPHTNYMEVGFDQLLKQAQMEAYPEDIQQQLATLKLQARHYEQEDLKAEREGIKRTLEESIVGQYYFQQGVIEARLGYDQAIQQAFKLFENPEQYKALLGQAS